MKTGPKRVSLSRPLMNDEIKKKKKYFIYFVVVIVIYDIFLMQCVWRNE